MRLRLVGTKILLIVIFLMSRLLFVRFMLSARKSRVVVALLRLVLVYSVITLLRLTCRLIDCS